jgi:hypothetical protein
MPRKPSVIVSTADRKVLLKELKAELKENQLRIRDFNREEKRLQRETQKILTGIDKQRNQAAKTVIRLETQIGLTVPS